MLDEDGLDRTSLPGLVNTLWYPPLLLFAAAVLPLLSGGKLDGKLGPALLPDVASALFELDSGCSDGGNNRGGAMSARILVQPEDVDDAVAAAVLGIELLGAPTVLENAGGGAY